MKKKFPPPSHHPVSTRDKKQKREKGSQTSIQKASRRREKDRLEEESKKEKLLIEQVKREKLVAINWDRISPRHAWNPLGVKTLKGRYYLDMPFHCVDCRSYEVWTGRQQQWWYEIAGGDPQQIAIRCRTCRIRERARRDAARKTHLEGLERKRLTQSSLGHLMKKSKRKRPGNW